MALALIPNPGQNLNDTRAAIRGNFVTLQADFGINHLPYGAVNEGKHNCVTLPTDHSISGTNNLPATNSSECLIYSANGPVSINPELFFQRQSQTAETGYTFTESSIDGGGNGWTRWPSGMIIKWGQASGANFEGNSSSAKGNVTFITGGAIPTFNVVYQIFLSQRWMGADTSIGSNGFAVRSTTVNGFKVDWTGTNSTGTILTYLAIGI